MTINEDQLQELIDAHGAALALYARQWCRSPEDAVQEGFLELLRQETFPDCPVAWLYTTVRRRAMNLARADRRRENHHRQACESRESWFLPPQVMAAQGPTFDSADIQWALAELPALDREIVVVRLWGELTFDQIANLVAQSTSTVHRRYQRALGELGRLLQEREEMRPQHERKATIPNT